MKIGLIGSTGRMGTEILSCIDLDPVASCCWGISSSYNGKPPLPPVDVIIDFSLPEALTTSLSLATSAKTPLVIGTTGIDCDMLVNASRVIPVFWSPNFSLGLFVQTLAATLLASLFPCTSTLITETHHVHKKDAPSGSALRLQKALEKEGKTPLITSIRQGDTVGIHSVTLENAEESLTLTHQAFTRRAFAKGALAAAKFLIKKNPGLYQMEDLLNGSILQSASAATGSSISP